MASANLAASPAMLDEIFGDTDLVGRTPSAVAQNGGAGRGLWDTSGMWL